MADIHRTIDAVWRIESAKLIAGLARMVRDVGLAEDLAQDALVAALEKWPVSGVPDKPGAWLMAISKNRAIDMLRRNKKLQQKLDQYGKERGKDLDTHSPDFSFALDRPVEDDILSLIFTACHPVLPTEARVALTLRLIGGLSTEEIARAYLARETAIAQRIVRAKRSLSEAKVPIEVPRGVELVPRLASVLEVIYLIFNEGYSATSGGDWMRPALCDEALRLGRILAALMVNTPEVHGLVALMEIQASRSRARIGPNGEPVLLLDQNRGRWDPVLIHRGFTALERAERLGGPLGPYTIQAAIAACHARARRAEDTDWTKIAALYDVLSQTTPSPVVELNRAVAVSMAYGPEAGLEIVDTLLSEPVLAAYHFLPSVRGDLLFKLGRFAEAGMAFKQAARKENYEIRKNNPPLHHR